MSYIFLTLFFTVLSHQNKIDLDIETGSCFLSYCDVQIPKSRGTRISFTDELTTNPAWFVRCRFTYFLNRQNSLSVLVAPLTLHGSGSLDHDIVFEGVTFPAHTDLNTGYRFNSYRLSYQHYWFLGTGKRLGLGATAKIRDAAISIRDSLNYSEKTNIGFVPIIRFSFLWQLTDPLTLLLEGDALAAPQGRAEDISFTLNYRLHKNILVKAGYRVLEGGSNVEAVYNFTWVNYLLGGLVLSF